MKKSFWTTLFDFVAPRQCVCCQRRLSTTQSTLCTVCQLHLPLTHFEQQAADNPLARRFWGIMPIERAAAWFYYEPQSEVSQLIYALKYNHRPDIGREMGRMAARRMAAEDFFSDIDAIVPVPLSRGREWSRGYNQSREIARGIADATGLPVYGNVARRLHFKQSQTHLSQWQRQANTASVFRLADEAKISGKHVLLVDDIVTTGATIIALAEELSKAGDVVFSVFALGYTKS